MFSKAQKQKIAAEVERLLLSFQHPEMPTEKPKFTLHVSGKGDLSWALIVPNWTFTEENPPGVNPHNEAQDRRSHDLDSPGFSHAAGYED